MVDLDLTGDDPVTVTDTEVLVKALRPENEAVARRRAVLAEAARTLVVPVTITVRTGGGGSQFVLLQKCTRCLSLLEPGSAEGHQKWHQSMDRMILYGVRR